MTRLVSLDTSDRGSTERRTGDGVESNKGKRSAQRGRRGQRQQDESTRSASQSGDQLTRKKPARKKRLTWQQRLSKKIQAKHEREAQERLAFEATQHI